MKRTVRWIGIGITAAAAATMLLADVALAQPIHGEGHRPTGGTGVRDSYAMRFDILSPGGMTCEADAPGSRVSYGRNLVGGPYIHIFGNPRAATITCTDDQGRQWQATAQRTAPYTPGRTTYGTVVHRRGNEPTMTIVEVDQRVEYQPKTFVPLD